MYCYFLSLKQREDVTENLRKAKSYIQGNKNILFAIGLTLFKRNCDMQ